MVFVPKGVNPVMPDVVVAVQLKVAPAGFEVRLTNVVEVPEQIVSVNGELVRTGTVFMVKILSVAIVVPHSLVTDNETV